MTERTELTKAIEKELRRIIRKRDNMTCQHCGRRVRGSNAHMSHVKSKKAYPHLRFDLMNLKLLCFHCHINWWHKEPTEAGRWFAEKFPDRLKYLEAQEHRKITINELKELLEKYTNM